MQAQLLPILLLAIPLALCVICVGGGARGPELAPVRAVARTRGCHATLDRTAVRRCMSFRDART